MKYNLLFKLLQGSVLCLCYLACGISMCVASGRQQSVTVTGTVTEATNGEQLLGVNVLIKGSTNGTITGIDGTYTLEVNDPNAILVFSFIGYIKQEVPLNGRTVLDITLAEDIETLEEVIVVGYGTVRKSDLTGSISSLSKDEFNAGVQTSVDQMIQGRAPGVKVTQASSEPGGGVSIRIRGTNSINAGNEPLYVIDGLPIVNSPVPGSSVSANQAPRNPLASLNPGDIENIEVLKDASATAIYGSRGSNGVILITTKKGKAGGIKVIYDGYFGVSSVAKKLDLLSTSEYINVLNDIREDEGNPPEFTSDQIAAIGKGTDWQDAITRKASVQSHQLSFSGGSDQTQYYISLNYLDQEGIVISSATKSYIARVNISHSVDKFNFGVNLNTSVQQDDYVPFGIAINASAGVMASALQMDPTLPIYNEDGSYYEPQNIDLDNPVAIANTFSDESETNRTFGNLFVEYELVKNLKAKINFGSDRQFARRDGYISNVTKRGQSTNGKARINQQERTDYLIEATLNYQNEFNPDNRLNAVVGYTYQQFNGRGFDAGTSNLLNDAFLTNNLGSGDQEENTIGSGRYQSQLLSYLGRANYTFKDRYLVTASFRIDGSSRFGSDNKDGYFPSMALGWRLAEEDFISSMNLFSDLKLRLSYGLTGNQEIGNYNAQVLLGTSGDAIFDDNRVTGIAPSRSANPDLKWETTSQFNIGLDYGFIQGRLTGSIDYYTKHTSDLLLYEPAPLTSGFGSSLQNVGDTRNSGFEFLITSDNIIGDFNWSTTLNIATVKNEVVDLGSADRILLGDIRFVSEFAILKEGEPVNSYFGYKTDGVFQNQEEVNNSSQPAAAPGDLRYVDVNEDGVIDQNDRTILGDPFAKISFGINNDFSYKGFSLSIFIEGQSGADMLNFTKIDSERPIQFRRNRLDYVLDRWTEDNSTNEQPSFLNNVQPVTDRVVEDASFIRLKNVRLGYSFTRLPAALSSLTIYASGQNLITLTDYSGFDPDVSVLGSSNLRVDYNAYPLARIFSIGLNIGL